MVQVSVLARTPNPAGGLTTVSKWLIHTGWGPSIPRRTPSLERFRVARIHIRRAHLSDLTSKQMRHELLTVADAEHGRTRSEQRRIDGGAARIVHARRTARNNDALAPEERRGRSLAGHDLRIHSEVANFAGDQMAVLSAGIEDSDLRCQLILKRTTELARDQTTNPDGHDQACS